MAMRGGGRLRLPFALRTPEPLVLGGALTEAEVEVALGGALGALISSRSCWIAVAVAVAAYGEQHQRVPSRSGGRPWRPCTESTHPTCWVRWTL